MTEHPHTWRLLVKRYPFQLAWIIAAVTYTAAVVSYAVFVRGI